MAWQLARFLLICISAAAVLVVGVAFLCIATLHSLNLNAQQANGSVSDEHATAIREAAPNVQEHELRFAFDAQTADVPDSDSRSVLEIRKQQSAESEEATRARIAGYDASQARSRSIRDQIEHASARAKRQQRESSRKVTAAAEAYAQSLERRKVIGGAGGSRNGMPQGSGRAGGRPGGGPTTGSRRR